MQKRILFQVAFLALFFSAQVQSQTNHSNKKENSALILFDAFSRDSSLAKGWGYSTLVQYEGKKILFDAGSNADVFERNVKSLGVDLKNLDMVVVSHAHFDHLDGIDYLLNINPDVKIYFPDDLFWGAPSLFNATGQDSLVRDSLPMELRYFNGRGDVFSVEQSGGRFRHANIEFVKNYKEIFPGIKLVPTRAQYMGYFSKYPKNFTPGNFSEANEDVKLNNLPELSLALATDKGDVLLVGCSHSGVEFIVQESIAKTGSKVDLLIGGFHLLPFNRKETQAIVKMLKNDLKVKKVAPGHCTGHLAFKILKDSYHSNFIYAGLGEKLVF